MLVLVVSILLYLSIYDFCYKKIPNIAVLSIAVVGLVHHYCLDGYAGLTDGFYGLSTGISVSLIFYRFTSLGAGDVKLISAIGCLVGSPSLILVVIAYSYIASAIIGILYIKVWLPWYQKTNNNVSESNKLLSQRVPMAPGISLSTFYVLYIHFF